MTSLKVSVLLTLFFAVYHCYISVDDNYLYYSNAENYCLTQFDSHLATITSAEEDNDAYNSNAVTTRYRWIGLNKISPATYQNWIDGTPVTYTNWASFEPNGGAGEDCVTLAPPNGHPTHPAASRWHDLQCNEANSFICNDMVSSCLQTNNIKKLDWDQILTNSSYAPYINLKKFNVDSNNLQLNIEIELLYLQDSSIDYGNDDGYGTTYWLDFQSFNGNNLNKIYEPGSCGNRLKSSYYTNATLKDFNQWWLWSETQYKDQHLGNDNYLSYPNPGNLWTLSVSEGDFVTACSKITYSAIFEWSDLFNCDGVGNTIVVNEDDKFINLTGIFYVDLVSPLVKDSDSNFYRVYEILSKEFEISLIKTAQILSNININLFDIYLLSIFSENDQGNFKINIITESSYFIYLENASILNYPLTLSNIESININTYSISTSCIATEINICRQIFQINIVFGQDYCNANNTLYDVTGSYTMQFDINCQNDVTTNCNDYVNNYGNYVILSIDTAYIDNTCDITKPQNISSYDVVMRFYPNSNFANWSNISLLYEYGVDTVFIQIEAINLPSNIFDYVSLSLTNVWICQYDDSLGELPDPSINTINGGCLANNTYDFNMYFHIYPSIRFDTMIYNNNLPNIVQFSFKVPDEGYNNMNRDKLFIHSEIELSLNDNISLSRRILLETNNFIMTDFAQIGQNIIVFETSQIETTTIVSNTENDNTDSVKQNNHIITVIFMMLITSFCL